MEGRLGDRIENMGGDIKRNQDDIKEVRKLVCDTESNLLDRMDDQKRQLETMIKASGAAQQTPRLSPKNEEAYWLHRRSLSVWPVHGDDATAGVKEFLMRNLKFSEEQIKDLGKVSVKRLKEPIPKARKEIFCIFETKETRDLVKASGKNLAGLGREVGMRAQFPGFLMDTFRLFESIAFNLKEGDEDFRRAIKFYDTAMDLMMDVRIGEEWSRIKPAEARITIEKNPHIRRGPSELKSDVLTEMLMKIKNKSPATGANASPMQ